MVFSVAAVHEEAVLQPGNIPGQEATPGGPPECCLKLGGGSLEALKRQYGPGFESGISHITTRSSEGNLKQKKNQKTAHLIA